MPTKIMFSLRGPDGRCRTQIAGSPRAALKKFMAGKPESKAPPGDWEVWERGESPETAEVFRVG